MSSPIPISDDDDSFSPMDIPDAKEQSISDDTTMLLSSDDEFDSEFPPVDLKAKKSAVIRNLFPATASHRSNYNVPPNEPSMENKTRVHISPNVTTISEPKNLGIEARIAGLKVKLPLKPYPSQMALLSKVKILYFQIKIFI